LETNVIYNEDCIKGMKNRIPDNSIDLILTDIPYGEVTKKGKKRAQYKGQLRSFNKKEADKLDFKLNNFLNLIYQLCSGSIYLFCGIEQVSYIFSWFDKKKDVMVRQCAWKKTNPSPVNGQHMWLSTIENCVFIKKRKTKFKRNCKPAVWEFPVGQSKRHPTQKPIKLFEHLIKSSTNNQDLVLDPLIGSGTTGVACLKTDRKFIGFEKEEKYYNIALKRIGKFDKSYYQQLPEEEKPKQKQLF